jgi:MFS family permease
MIAVFQEVAGAWLSTSSTMLYGSLAGALGGTAGGILGALTGVLAPRGKARGLVLGFMYAFCVFGLVNLIFGLVALIAGQPYAVWYPFLLMGSIFPLVFGFMIPVVKRVYRQAEQRRLEAADLRAR